MADPDGPLGRLGLDPAVPAAAPEVASFAELGVRSETVEALARQSITHPFAIQTLAIPIALGGHDVVGQARTGTGKTLAFGIPILERVTTPAERDGDGRPQALVVVPTRELAMQVAGDLDRAGSTRGVRVLAVYGGRAYEPQVQALRHGIEVVVGTPGRLLDLGRQRALDLGGVRTLVLDEADEMLDLGFLPDVERLVAQVPGQRQTMLFSATMPHAVVTLGRRYLTRPTHIRAEHPSDSHTVPDTEQFVFRAHALDKPEVLARVLQARERGLVIVFARTKRACDTIAADLTGRGFAAAAVHGDLGQAARERALRAFRAGKIDVLVATDVAARGIDVAGVTHVINYSCPEDEKIYLHRIGRTGRAGESGVAVTFVDWADTVRWKVISTMLALGLDEPEETYSTSPNLYAELDIPAEATGRLPVAARTRSGLESETLEDIGETGRGRSRSSRPSPPPAAPAERTARSTDQDRPRRRRRRRRAGVVVEPTDRTGASGREAGATPPAQPTSV